MQGLFCLGVTEKSILRDDRTVEEIVQANGADIYILADVVDAGQARERRKQVEGDALGTHEQVIVLGRNGPVRGKAKLDAGTGYPAPTGLGPLAECHRGRNNQVIVLVLRDRCTALAWNKTLLTAYPTYPVKRPIALTLDWSVTKAGKTRFALLPLKLAQLP